MIVIPRIMNAVWENLFFILVLTLSFVKDEGKVIIFFERYNFKKELRRG
jgi:hypothetical protein